MGGGYDGYNGVSASNIRVSNAEGSTATLRKQDGDWSATQDFRVGEGNGSLGTFQHSGGTLSIGRTLFVGSANYASAKNNSVTIDGGTVYASGIPDDNNKYRAVILGSMAKSTGTAYLTVSGTGRLVVTQANNIWIGRGGAGHMTIADDAVVDVSNGLVAFFGGELARDNIGNASKENCVCFLYLNGGTLLTQCIKYGASDSKDHRLRVGMYFNGGTLKATADSDSFIMIPSGDTTPDGNVRVMANGGTIDTNGHTINVRQKLDPPNSGTSGDLVITGGGTYKQTGVTAYNGCTIIDGRTKYIKNNASSNLKLVVKSGSSFQNAATLASRVAGESLTFEDGAKLVVEPTANQIAVSAPEIDVQGALTVSLSSRTPAVGVYTLMKITGSGTFADDVLSRITIETADFTPSLSADGKTISMIPAKHVPAYAKMVKGEDDVYAWRFYNYYWDDITDTCGLSVPNSTIKVYVTSTEEVQPILANPGTPAGYRIGNLSANADLTSLSPLVIEAGSEIDLNGHALTVSGSVLNALTIINGNFEAKFISDGDADTSAISGWSKSGTVALIKNNNTYAYKQSSSGEKENQTVMCYIAKSGYITQTFNVTEEVWCTLSLNKANRNWYNGGKKNSPTTGYVYVDGNEKIKMNDSGGGDHRSFSATFLLAAGEHTLKIACHNDGEGILVDNVKLTCNLPLGRITSSVEGGELHVNVPSGSIVENSAVNITGYVKLVKEGAGTFVSTLAQTYTDGTLVAAGTAQEPANQANSGGQPVPVYGSGAITVESGATFTVRSAHVLKNDIVLAGGSLYGTLNNVVAHLTRVAADSQIVNDGSDVHMHIGAAGSHLDLDGHTLTFSGGTGKQYIYIDSLLAGETGRFVFDSSVDYVCKLPVDGNGVDFEINYKAHMSAPASVHDYKISGEQTEFGYGTAYGLDVYGTFTPVSATFYGCTMMDGSTIDLSGKTGTWSIQSLIPDAVSSYGFTEAQQTARKTVSFADNATIYVKLGDRRGLSRGVPIISWTTRPSNLDGLTFRRAEDNVEMSKRDDGVYLAPGLICIIR